MIEQNNHYLKQQGNAMESVALYLRMSSDAQDLSLAQQEKELRQHCKRQAFRVVSVYKDAGISGDDFKRRKGLQQLLADASSGKYRRLLAWDQDRIGRFDSLTSGKVLAPLREAGITIETIAQGVLDLESFAGRVTFAVQQEAKNDFLKGLSRNTLRGQAAKAESANGYHGGPLLFGYERVTELQGMHRVSRLVINEPQAALVRRAFSLYLKPDMSFAKIAEQFNSEGIPSPRSKPYWEGDTIRYWLRNIGYTGTMAYGRRSTGKHSRRTDEGIVLVKPGQKVKPAAPIVHYRPDIIPPLVDQATFDKVQELIAERRKAGTRRHGTTHALSGIVVCDKCGRKFHQDSGKFLCSSSKSTTKPDRCYGHRLDGELLLQLLDDTITKHLLSDSGVALLKERLRKLMASRAKKADDTRPAMRKRLATLERQLKDGAARLLQVPAGLVAELSAALDAVRAERDELQAELKPQKASRAGESGAATRLDDIIAIARDLPKLRRKVTPAAYNATLKAMGAEIRVLQNDREAVKVEARLIRSGDLLGTPARASGVTEWLVVLKFRLPPAKLPGFQPGNKHGRGFDSERGRQASRARWKAG